MQRAPKYVCKKDMNPPDDNFDGPSATVVNFPKEFQGWYIYLCTYVFYHSGPENLKKSKQKNS